MNEIDTARLSNQLLEARRAKGITQKKASEELGMTTSMLSALEKGERAPSLNALVQLATYYELSLDEIFGLKSKEKETPWNAHSLINELIHILNKWPNISMKVESKQIVLFIKNYLTYEEYDKDEEITWLHTLVEFFHDYQTLLDLKRKGIIKDSVIKNWVDGELEKITDYDANGANPDESDNRLRPVEGMPLLPGQHFKE